MVLSDKGWEWSGTAGELSDAIIARQGDDEDEKTKTIFSSRRVGKALNKYFRQFSIIFRLDEPKLSEGRTRYRFNGMTTLGQQAVGLVDLSGSFQKSAGRGSAHGFMENTALNPPNPPGDAIRARAHSPLPFKEEEDVESGIDNDIEWDI